MKKILIIQNSTETPPGTTLEWCQDRKIMPVVLQAWSPIVWDSAPGLISDPTVLGVVICGGGMNVDEEEKHPWLTKEKLFIKLCLDQNIKILGLCLGAQLMAEVSGAKVGPQSHWEVGWHSVELQNHPYLPAKDSTIEAFQWHRYSFATPGTATRLGESKGCANQAFVFKNHGLAFQFHPESSPAWIRACAHSKPENYPQGPFVQDPSQILQQMSKQPILQDWYWTVLDRFFLRQR